MPTPVWSISQFLPAFLSWATLATTYQNVLWCLSLVLTCDLPHPLSHTSSRCVLIFFSEMGKLRLGLGKWSVSTRYQCLSAKINKKYWRRKWHGGHHRSHSGVLVRADPCGAGAGSMETTCVLPTSGASIIKWAADIKCHLKSIYRDKRQHQFIT